LIKLFVSGLIFILFYLGVLVFNIADEQVVDTV